MKKYFWIIKILFFFALLLGLTQVSFAQTEKKVVILSLEGRIQTEKGCKPLFLEIIETTYADLGVSPEKAKITYSFVQDNNTVCRNCTQYNNSKFWSSMIVLYCSELEHDESTTVFFTVTWWERINFIGIKIPIRKKSKTFDYSFG